MGDSGKHGPLEAGINWLKALIINPKPKSEVKQRCYERKISRSLKIGGKGK